VGSYAQIDAELARKADQKIAVTVERWTKGAVKRTIPVAPNPMRRLGLVMKMGEITAVQAGSPAAQAGILPGDLVRKIDAKPVGDPMTLPEQLDDAAGKKAELTVQREASKTPIVVPVLLREPIGYSPPEMIGSPVAVASLGIAYRVLNRVDRVIEGSPAAKAGLLPEDLIVRVKLIPPDKKTLRELNLKQPEVSVSFSEAERNWPSFISPVDDLSARERADRDARSGRVGRLVQPGPRLRVPADDVRAAGGNDRRRPRVGRPGDARRPDVGVPQPSGIGDGPGFAAEPGRTDWDFRVGDQQRRPGLR
jgi:membrane-associated protease RseP (regulator of RpoE activity)